MAHIQPVSKSVRPAFAASLLEWQQIGATLSAFGSALGTFGTAFNTFNTMFLNKREALNED